MNLVKGIKKKALEVALGESTNGGKEKQTRIISNESASDKQEEELPQEISENSVNQGVSTPSDAKTENNSLELSNDSNSSNSSSDPYTPYFREYKILIEYKHLPAYVPSGVYILPSANSIFVWHGVIFIRQGLYRRGIFKFAINIPSNYPELCPSVNFFSDVYHPQIGTDGQLDLSKDFSNWNPENNFLWHVVAYIKSIFYQINLKNPLNKEAAELVVKNRKEFEIKVKECVENSIDNCYIIPSDCGLKLTEWKKEHDVLQASILGQKSEDNAKEGLLSWVSSGIGSVTRILNIKY